MYGQDLQSDNFSAVKKQKQIILNGGALVTVSGSTKVPHKSYTLLRCARRAFLFFTASSVKSSGSTPALCILSMTS